MEVISGDRHVPVVPEQLLLAAEEDMTPFPEVANTLTTTAVSATVTATADFVSSANPTADVMVTMLMNNRPLPAKKLRPIRRSPEPTAEKPHDPLSHDEAPEIFGSGQEDDLAPTLGSFEDEFSSSSDDEYDDGGVGGGGYASTKDIKEPANRKRRRKSSKKIEFFLESLVMQVMQKQEQFYQQLIEMIEQRERERIMREEEWKQRETERIKRDEEMRAQEISRGMALISLIQNVLGNDIEISQPSTVSCMDGDGSKMNLPKDYTSDQVNKRWPDAEVQALIMLRTSLEQKFRSMGSKSSVWDEISVGMQNMGYNRTAKKCKEKWENINKYFKKSIENGKKPHESGKTCPYFHELGILYKNGVVNSGNPLNHANDKNATKIEGG